MKFSRRFWRATTEQVASAGAAGYLAGWTVSGPGRYSAVFAGLVALYYLLKCVASEPLGERDSPMLTKDH